MSDCANPPKVQKGERRQYLGKVVFFEHEYHTLSEEGRDIEAERHMCEANVLLEHQPDMTPILYLQYADKEVAVALPIPVLKELIHAVM